MRSCPSAHGYSTSKSTAFSPLSSKYGTQSLLHDHMMSHYHRIQSAKSTIDNKPPKSRELHILNKLGSRKSGKRREHHISRNLDLTMLSEPSAKTTFHLDSGTTFTKTNYYEQRQKTEGQGGYTEDIPRIDSIPLNSVATSSSDFGPSTNGNAAQFTTRRSRNDPRLETTSLDLKLDQSIATRTARPTLNETNKYAIGGRSQAVGPWADRPHSTLSISRHEGENYSIYPEFQLAKKKKDNLEDEQKYLDFMNDVTKEVINRGIYSNRVLMHVFKGHVEKRKRDLKEERMWAVIHQLKEDLHIDEEDDL